MTSAPRGPVVVTGATGFVGRALVAGLLREGVPVRAALRADGPPARALPPEVERHVVGDLAADADWGGVLAGADGVIHLAARVHVMHDTAADPLAAFRAANVDGSERLARAAARAGVRRLVFASSIKVLGESTPRGRPFDEDAPPRPVDPYGVSKLEAELRLRAVAGTTALEVAILRPVLMYGPGVKGNLQRLAGWIRRGVPLPFASVDNRRSLLGVENFADALIRALSHPAAAGATFLVADGEDLSTPELVRRLAHAIGRPARLVPVPPAVLRALGAALGRRDEVARLLGSLQVDASRLRRELGWRPPVPLDAGLARMAAADRPDEARSGPA